jgi:UDP-N-acetyl-D-glucosamine/UDP-N-acetyl-D-galactosamine dehydrogenase
VVGFDVDAARVAELRQGNDRTREVEVDDLRHASLLFTADPTALRQSDFYIVTVPTPIDDVRRPDLARHDRGLSISWERAEKR